MKTGSARRLRHEGSLSWHWGQRLSPPRHSSRIRSVLTSRPVFTKGWATYDHSIGRDREGRVEVRLSAGDWYKIALTELDSDPIKAARDASQARTRWPDEKVG